MKLNKYFKLLFLAIAITGFITSCSDDEGGQPVISYVRVTKPSASDSLLVAAGQGQMVAIMGQNLGDIRQLWFNDQQATLTPTLITNTTIIVRVPSQIPTEISNKMKLIFGDGETLLYDFSVDISEPHIDYMKSEYVNEGDIAVINGDFFYEPLQVIFAGGVQGDVVSVTDQQIKVTVPEGAGSGPITIINNFGVAESTFWFKDNRNIIASFDGTFEGMWHGPNYVVESDPAISNVDNKFVRLNRNFNAWDWFELYVGPSTSDAALELKNIPQEAFAKPDEYVLKLELNTLASLTGANIHIYIGPNMAADRGTNYNWQPNINTNGEWETVSIPWDDIYAANQEFAYNPDGYGISIHIQGPNAVTANFGLDNLRVVPIVAE